MSKNSHSEEVRADATTLVTGVSPGGDKLVYFTADAPDLLKYADVVVIGKQRLTVHQGVLHVIEEVGGEQTVYDNISVRRYQGGKIVEGDARKVPNPPVKAEVMPTGTNIAEKLLAIQQGVLGAFVVNGGKIAIDHSVEGGRILVGKMAKDALTDAAEQQKAGEVLVSGIRLCLTLNGCALSETEIGDYLRRYPEYREHLLHLSSVIIGMVRHGELFAQEIFGTVFYQCGPFDRDGANDGVAVGYRGGSESPDYPVEDPEKRRDRLRAQEDKKRGWSPPKPNRLP
ncbi:MAG: hypothetical protein AAB588_00560 [Patescibacteria group bacterium]